MNHSKEKTLGELLDALRADLSITDPSYVGGRTFPSLAAEVRSKAVRGITADSRKVKPGFVYVAVCGVTLDGHHFIGEALQKGAVFVIGSEDRPEPQYLQVSTPSRALGILAAEFYGNPARSLWVLGVTGTSGKTTTTYVLESILVAAGKKVGLIGTVECRVGDQVWESTHTTPGAVELQHLLRQMVDLQCDVVVMEVSSHALKQDRVAGIGFDGAIFTNLTPEHLDYHPDLEDYYQSKARLFREWADDARRMGKKPVAAIGLGDAFGRRLLEQDHQVETAIGFGALSPHLNPSDLDVTLSGIAGRLLGIPIRSDLIGTFNALNLLGAIGLSTLLDLDPLDIARGVERLKGVPGRLERIENQRGIHAFVDYAHKPDALRNVLETINSILQPMNSEQGSFPASKSRSRLVTVFGCGGDRDRQKRPVMGRIAAEMSDFLILTNDNPRTEDPLQILSEIIAGILPGSRAGVPEVIPDRPKAIHLALERAAPGDVVLVAGKGHENYQILLDPNAPPELKQTLKVPMDDRELMRTFLMS
jgi:UDP-N-acetylmuramoyl-L-alanyl-D-glutamate--2,6-diaminopimelate ligase